MHASPGYEPIPDLYDVVLLGRSASSLVLTGHERTYANHLHQRDRVHGQTVIVEPTHEADIMSIERMWNESARRPDVRLAAPQRRNGTA